LFKLIINSLLYPDNQLFKSINYDLLLIKKLIISANIIKLLTQKGHFLDCFGASGGADFEFRPL